VSDFLIRAAMAEDAETVAALNFACWRETYAGLVPCEIVAAMTLEERIDYWRGAFDGPRVALAFDAHGAAVGFSSWRPHDLVLRGRLGHGGEISAIYLLRSAQRRGLGRELMRRMAQEMLEARFGWASLVVLRDNAPARRFYEALGGWRLGAESHWRGVPQLAYGWRRLERLADHQ
jgi:ribosomal protein S18 acetylase RimI-like enzyme